MSITTLLAMGMGASILITIGFGGLHFETRKRLEELEGALKRCDSELTDHKREIRILNERAEQESDKITIVCEPDNTTAPDYGHF